MPVSGVLLLVALWSLALSLDCSIRLSAEASESITILWGGSVLVAAPSLEIDRKLSFPALGLFIEQPFIAVRSFSTSMLGSLAPSIVTQELDELYLNR